MRRSRFYRPRRRATGRAMGVLALVALAGPARGWAPPGQAPLPTAPYAGYVNHAQAQPPFRWGWFGAERFYPQVAWGRDYNGEVVRWSRNRRY